MNQYSVITQSQRTFPIDLGYTVFDSNFDSGNLFRVEKLSTNRFILWPGQDCQGSQFEWAGRCWFHFSITHKIDATLFLSIRGTNMTPKIYREGMKPVFRNQNQKNWKRIPSNCDYVASQDNNFELKFAVEVNGNKTQFIAFTYPWSYTQNLRFWAKIVMKADVTQLYIHKENLIYSLDRRRWEILTITSYKNIKTSQEPPIEELYPWQDETRAWDFQRRKKIVLLTARVHPGETPASHMMNGIISFLVSADPRAKLLRDQFVFKIIPMINPDGVYRGHFRSDQLGVNINRMYVNPQIAEQPTAFAIRRYYNRNQSRIHTFIDLHGHTQRKGAFLFGNFMDYRRLVESFLLPKLIELN